MATYDLAYPGAAIDAILNTSYFLQEAGYIFQGSASEYSGTPSKRVWLIAPAGSTGFGLSSAVPQGSIGICLYNGTSWVGKIINVATIDSTPTQNSGNAVSSGGAYAAINQLSAIVTEALENLTFTDTTPSAFQDEYINMKVSTTEGGVERILTYLTILAATTSKAGLMSAEDKAKVDSFLANLRSLTFTDTTASADQGTKITETLKATIGGVQEVIDSITLLAATSSKAGLLSASDKAYIDALPATLTSLSNSISAALALMESLVGYYVCDTAAGTAAKTVSASGYVLTNGGCIRIKMTNANTADNVTLNINSTGAKALYYDGAQASSTNTWEAGEVLEVYYDGTQYQCASGGGEKFASGQKVKEVSITDTLNDTTALIESAPVKEAVDAIKENIGQMSDDIYGEPVEKTGTWGTWRVGTSTRIFTICDQLAVLNGVVSVKLTDYTTYRCAVVIQQGTAWNSTVITDTGWKTADISKTIASAEVGYNIKISVSRIDNGAISPSEAATIVSSLSYTYMGPNENGVIPDINDLYNKIGDINADMEKNGLNDFVYNKVDVSSLTQQDCCLTTTTWYSIGKHKAIPVTAGGSVKVKVTKYDAYTTGEYTGYYGFCTSEYNPPYTSGQQIPSAGSEKRYAAPLGELLTVDVPEGAAYLIINTIDGAGKKVEWNVSVSDTFVNVLDSHSEKLEELNAMGVNLEYLNTDMYGVPYLPFGSWGSFKVHSSSRVYVLCDQLSEEGGTIKVALNDYSTYRFAVTIQNGTAYASTALYDSGWQRSDFEKVVANSEAGYNIRVAFARIDDGSITVEDVQASIRTLQYIKPGSGGNSVLQRLTDVEKSTKDSILPMPIKNEQSKKYYGKKIDFTEEYNYQSTPVADFPSASVGVQGGTSYGDYFFQFHATNSLIIVVNLATGQVVQQITLTENPNCHANSASFGGQKYNSSDTFPCIYVSSSDEYKTYVYRITGTEGSFVFTLVQTLTFEMWFNIPNITIDSTNMRAVVFGYKLNAWNVAANNETICCCFDLPDVTAGDMVLKNPYNEFRFPFLYAMQSGFGMNGKIYHAFGNTSAGLRIGGIVVVNYVQRVVETFIDISGVGGLEPEGLGMWDGGLVFSTQGHRIYKLTFE